MQGVHITGASGSGVTTLGRALAEHLGWSHLDTDSFYWLPTDPPFRERRPPEPRMAMLRNAIAAAHEGWTLSGSLDGWGDPLIPDFRLVVFVFTPHPIRMARLMARERERYGEAIAPGGPMHAQHLEFVRWAEGYDHGDRTGRSLPRHEAWLSTLPGPVLRLDGALPTEVLTQATLRRMEALG